MLLAVRPLRLNEIKHLAARAGLELARGETLSPVAGAPLTRCGPSFMALDPK